MKPTNLGRRACTLGGREITYQHLSQHYVCNECGGKPVHSFVPTDRVFCGSCGGDDFVSETAYSHQIADGYEVLDGLPDDLRRLVQKQEGDTTCQSAIEAVAALFG